MVQQREVRQVQMDEDCGRMNRTDGCCGVQRPRIGSERPAPKGKNREAAYEPYEETAVCLRDASRSATGPVVGLPPGERHDSTPRCGCQSPKPAVNVPGLVEASLADHGWWVERSDVRPVVVPAAPARGRTLALR